MKRFLILILFISIGLIYSEAQNMTVRQYIETYKDVAILEMKNFKVPASISLAQGILESGSGNSRLAKEGNNHFGIKCKKEWTGCTILEDDDALQECFRCYANAEESYKDHSAFLRNNRRYAGLFELEILDYKAWARGLLAAGYATNRKYADLLIGTIERNNLTRYDSIAIFGETPEPIEIKEPVIVVYNRVPSVVVGENQNLEAIAEASNKSLKKIGKYNDLTYHKQISPGDVIYLKPKKRKASVASHQVSAGETMWDISQKYAIRISSLYKKNLMDPGTEPLPGVILQLQDKALGRPDTGRIEPKPTRKVESANDAGLYIVKQGETLYSIAKQFNVTVEAIKRLNNLKSDQLYVGQHLKIQNKEENTGTNSYVVQAGDTLYSISKKFGISVEELKSLNKLVGDNLTIGQTLSVVSK